MFLGELTTNQYTPPKAMTHTQLIDRGYITHTPLGTAHGMNTA